MGGSLFNSSIISVTCECSILGSAFVWSCIVENITVKWITIHSLHSIALPAGFIGSN